MLVQVSRLDFQPLVAIEVDLRGWWWKRRGAGLDANGPRFLGGCLLDGLLQHYLLQLSDMADGGASVRTLLK